MEIKTNFSPWLSKKLLLLNIGFYATIGIIMLLPGLLANACLPTHTMIRLGAFFLVICARAIYENVVIYEVPFKKLAIGNIAILSLVTSGMLGFLNCTLAARIGFFSIPVSIIISMVIVGKLKTLLWNANSMPDPFAQLAERSHLLSISRYGFYLFLVGITYSVCHWYGMQFFTYAFAGSFFLGMLFEELYNQRNIYHHYLTLKMVIFTSIWSAFCALLATAIVSIMLNYFGYNGQAATIMGVIIVKLMQPLGALTLATQKTT